MNKIYAYYYPVLNMQPAIKYLSSVPTQIFQGSDEREIIVFRASESKPKKGGREEGEGSFIVLLNNWETDDF